jgi:glycosyltransferase involved in cell wall biosynthesis
MNSKPRETIVVLTDGADGPWTHDVRDVADRVAEGLGPSAIRCDTLQEARSASPAGTIYIPPLLPLADIMRRGNRVRDHIPGARHMMFSLAPVRESQRRWWVPKFRYPDPIVVLSYRSLLALTRMGLKGDVVSVGVDTDVFHAADDHVREVARSRLDLDANSFVFLWEIDPIDPDIIIELKKRVHGAVVVGYQIGGAPPDSARDKLVAQDIRILDPPEQLLELFWGADALVYSQERLEGAIDLPLRVLAALATGLCVLTRPVGGLRDFFEPDAGICYWNDIEELVAAAERVREGARPRTRDMAPFSWRAVAGRLARVLLRSSDRELAVPGPDIWPGK